MQTPRFREQLNKCLLFATVLLMLVTCEECKAQSEQPKKVDSFTWKSRAQELAADCKLENDSEMGDVIRVERTTGSKQQIPLITIDKPKLTERTYFVHGKIKYQDVDQTGFLEMWSNFEEPKAGSYFSRTMDVSGLMGCISGSSGWREFSLPFMVNDESFPMPAQLQINLVLPNKGVVWMSDVTLYERPLPTQIAQANQSGNLLTTAAAFSPSWGLLIGLCLLVAILASLAGAGLLIFKQKRSQTNEIRRMEAMNIE
ncbi:MAG: hypothetical protein U0930_09250 [Pirellulales bacterium]